MTFDSYHRGLSCASLVIGLQLCGPSAAYADQAPPDAGGPTPPSIAQCVDAHRLAQELRQSDKLIESRQQLLLCSSEQCPGALVADCWNWLERLEQAVPSIVFQLERDGRDAPDASVELDGVKVADWSKALRANPGLHRLRIQLSGFPSHEEELVLSEGQRMRVVHHDFKQPAAPASELPRPVATPSRPMKRPTPFITYPLLGVGIAGLGAFGAFSAWGRSKEQDLDDHCRPRCTDAGVNVVKTRYLVGDISLGVGAAALVGALGVYLFRPEVSADGSASLSPTLMVGNQLGVGASGRF